MIKTDMERFLIRVALQDLEKESMQGYCIYSRAWSMAPKAAMRATAGTLMSTRLAADFAVEEEEELELVPELVPEEPSEVVGSGVEDLQVKEPRTVDLMSWKSEQEKLPVDCMLKPPLTCFRAGRSTLRK